MGALGQGWKGFPLATQTVLPDIRIETGYKSFSFETGLGAMPSKGTKEEGRPLEDLCEGDGLIIKHVKIQRVHCRLQFINTLLVAEVLASGPLQADL